MATQSLTKFISDQEAAVQIAREVEDMPSAFSIRWNALCAAMSILDDGGTSVEENVAAAKRLEKYLKDGK